MPWHFLKRYSWIVTTVFWLSGVRNVELCNRPGYDSEPHDRFHRWNPEDLVCASVRGLGCGF